MVRVRAKIEGAKTLCKQCEHSVCRTFDNNHEDVECTVFKSKSLRRPVIECSTFLAKGSQSLWDMEQKAWVLEVKKGRPMGFKRPGDKEDE